MTKLISIHRWLIASLTFSFLISVPQRSSAGEVAELKADTGPSCLLGAYYYAWYRSPGREGDTGWMRRAMRSKLKPAHLPKLGVYDSRNPKVIKEHIAQCVRAGIDFWSVSWWGPGEQDKTFRDHILKHPDAGKTKIRGALRVDRKAWRDGQSETTGNSSPILSI